MPITALPTPPNRNSPTTFADDGDEFLGALPTFVTEANTLETNVNAKEASATASALAAAGSATAAGAIKWVAATPYSIGDARYSPIDGQTYRCISATSDSTDPSANPTNWVRVNLTPQAGDAQETTGAANITLTVLSARIQAVNMTAQSLSVTLPVATTLARGGPLYVIKNTGTYTFGVRDSAAVLLASIAPGQCAAFYLSNSSTAAGTWVVGNESYSATALASIAPGTVSVINAVSSLYTSVAMLTATKALCVYTAGVVVYGVVLDVSNATITVGSVVSLTPLTGSSTSITMLTSTKALVCAPGASGYMNAMVLDVSGSTITPGTALVINAAASSLPSVIALSSTKAILAYNAASTYLNTVILNISGSTVTNGSVVVVNAVATTSISVAMLTATKAMCTYKDS